MVATQALRQEPGDSAPRCLSLQDRSPNPAATVAIAHSPRPARGLCAVEAVSQGFPPQPSEPECSLVSVFASFERTMRTMGTSMTE